MTRATVLSSVVAFAALIAPFSFPWLYALFLAFVLALIEPVAGLACGILIDALYYRGGLAHAPWGTIVGVLGAAIAYLVRRFVKTRIMGE